jgi:hypothetical protein
VEALEVEHGLEKAVSGGIAIDRGHDVGAERRADRGLAGERVGVGLPDQLGRDFGAVEAVGHAMHDRSFQGVMVQDGRIDEGCEFGLAPRDLLGLEADAGPDRVHLLEPPCPHLLLGHGCLPRILILRASLAHSPG